MATPEVPAESEERKMIAIGQRIELGKTVSEQDQLAFYRFMEAQLSGLLRGKIEPASKHPLGVQRIDDIYKGLVAARIEIELLNSSIMDAGGQGTGGSVGEGTLRDAHNPGR